jgi:two-component system, OmpR family, sensor histidine kinase KdpD
MRTPASPAFLAPSQLVPALLAWVAAWAAMLGLDGQVDLANLAMVLVLASALATLWLPIAVSLLLTALSVLAFNWLFVPPRHTLAVDLRQDALLLVAMLAVSSIVAGLMARQRVLAQSARRHARHAEQLRQLGETLRDGDDPMRSAARGAGRIARDTTAPARSARHHAGTRRRRGSPANR